MQQCNYGYSIFKDDILFLDIQLREEYNFYLSGYNPGHEIFIGIITCSTFNNSSLC